MGTDNNSRTAPIVTGVIVIVLIIGGALVYYGQQKDSADDTAPGDTTQIRPTDDQSGPFESGSEVSMQEAERIATDKYGGTVKETETDDYKGTPAWEVEIQDSKKGRIEVKVDKKTGEILGVEND